jgi:hypothetical protein
VIPPAITDGRRFTMLRSCAWCRRSMGEVECIPSQAGKVSHGICDACVALEFAHLPGPVRPTLNEVAAAQAASTLPGTQQPLQGKGTVTPGLSVPAVLEHPSDGPAASFTSSGGFWAAIDRGLKWLVSLGGGR